MKKLFAAVAVAAFTMVGIANAAFVAEVKDPTPNKTFTGKYNKPDGTQGTQVGYVAVYTDGVEACNGNPAITRPDNGAPLQGYIWVGSAHKADRITAADPGGNVGAGSNHQTVDGSPTGKSPCPRNG